MKNIILIIFSIIGFNFIAISANVDKQKEAKTKEWFKHKPLEFIENKGQFLNTEGKLAEEVLFKTSCEGLDIYITTKGLSYVFIKLGEKENETKNEGNISSFEKDVEEYKNLKLYRLDMNLVGANIDKSNIINTNEESRQGEYDYFYPHCPNGI
ncbi:MAG: hypothetical protein WCH34_09605 [Bacteroidota bacterium]